MNLNRSRACIDVFQNISGDRIVSQGIFETKRGVNPRIAEIDKRGNIAIRLSAEKYANKRSRNWRVSVKVRLDFHTISLETILHTDVDLERSTICSALSFAFPRCCRHGACHVPPIKGNEKFIVPLVHTPFSIP